MNTTSKLGWPSITRTRTYTNPNDTNASAAGRRGEAQTPLCFTTVPVFRPRISDSGCTCRLAGSITYGGELIPGSGALPHVALPGGMNEEHRDTVDLHQQVVEHLRGEAGHRHRHHRGEAGSGVAKTTALRMVPKSELKQPESAKATSRTRARPHSP